MNGSAAKKSHKLLAHWTNNAALSPRVDPGGVRPSSRTQHARPGHRSQLRRARAQPDPDVEPNGGRARSSEPTTRLRRPLRLPPIPWRSNRSPHDGALTLSPRARDGLGSGASLSPTHDLGPVPAQVGGRLRPAPWAHQPAQGDALGGIDQQAQACSYVLDQSGRWTGTHKGGEPGPARLDLAGWSSQAVADWETFFGSVSEQQQSFFALHSPHHSVARVRSLSASVFACARFGVCR